MTRCVARLHTICIIVAFQGMKADPSMPHAVPELYYGILDTICTVARKDCSSIACSKVCRRRSIQCIDSPVSCPRRCCTHVKSPRTITKLDQIRSFQGFSIEFSAGKCGNCCEVLSIFRLGYNVCKASTFTNWPPQTVGKVDRSILSHCGTGCTCPVPFALSGRWYNDDRMCVVGDEYGWE